jgi:hypothetical protein
VQSLTYCAEPDPLLRAGTKALQHWNIGVALQAYKITKHATKLRKNSFCGKAARTTNFGVEVGLTFA